MEKYLLSDAISTEITPPPQKKNPDKYSHYQRNKKLSERQKGFKIQKRKRTYLLESNENCTDFKVGISIHHIYQRLKLINVPTLR